ncbi:hypothetical protein COU62_02085 [Candidatus Pacearchaeota archaeon CG10_big_fil_rev_8_21_14_0_10_35_219]|nr:hypothetical protein [Candidatus Pacearchaeota archaeon]PIO07982.1 MAG: hypothetical protein COU62_02085 [Candidatus Pacearchaeota archaeon CG10_big_fil_rev_8_21_14_0_10_35_219]PIY81436.1 MAG: hypothetical protein COY79_02890 [Candidatus Pacearchaeota archaeon CG_4_10_14_0_8_um_filter_35_169]PIZ80600.1 MAG: hypothetical protein COY00_00555 [Candidatus Pacearchaeota archaeon CG_4_10_14_0_2_um_filter_35_33]PJA70097.1 MAG: hypothetical protein CO155_01520 [Candidatus Pacearchaeota archaeon CG_4
MSKIKSSLKIQRIKRDQELGSLVQISYDPNQPVVHLWTKDINSIRAAYAEMLNVKDQKKIGDREYMHFLYNMKKAGFDEFAFDDERAINGLVATREAIRNKR